ncbi:putative AC9 transposase [Merluccius polli]|uniref:AC9 transposase n=1 Tax=Merluccius polli TaxID=89951 RepID=A0AA47M3Y8_MERPO|nr:putative AC9 transposase [Merluccius polli]
MENNLKGTMEGVDFVSTTADIWTANNKSFMGVTIHWIDRVTLEHKKAALACKRMRGRHTFDAIAVALEEIHSSYGVLNKVVATVTDNASNFIKAFKTYHVVTSESDDDEDDEEGQDEVTFTDVSEALSVENDGLLTLPPHYRCASHTLNLISSCDIDKYLNSSTNTKAVYRTSVAKCTALWTKASRSTVASEQVHEVSQRKLLVPSSTRWNSFYNAVGRIAEIPMTELNSLCTKLGVKCFNDREYKFLHEYCIAMKPLTTGLDILQGDNCSYGVLLPTLEVLMVKTHTLKDTLSRMTADLADVIVNAIQTRFADVLDSKDALLAAVSCPKFKTRWLRDEDRKQRVKELLMAECASIAPVAEAAASVPAKSAVPGDGMDFFGFELEPEETYTAEK